MDGWMASFAWLNLRFCLCFIRLFITFHSLYFLIIIAADQRLRKSERNAAAPAHAAVNVNHDDLVRAAVFRRIKSDRLTVER